jgi:hypothetical protein
MAGQNIYSLDALSEQVIRIFTASRPTADVHLERREVSKAMRGVAAGLIRNRWFEMKNTKEVQHLGHIYMATFDGVEVKENDDTGEFYIDLPAIPEDLPDDTGIQNIQPETGKAIKDIPMIPLPLNADIILRQLPAGALEQRFGFDWRRDKVYFTEQNERTVEEEGIDTVQVRMITVGPEDVADEAPFPIPADLITMLLSQTLVIFGVSVDPERIDLVNDNR